jgi:hypothetical protein
MSITKTGKIKAMSSVAAGKPPRFAFLLDSGFVLKMHPATLKQWAPAKLKIGDAIEYDVDESTGALMNPRPVQRLCPCGDEPASWQKAHCLVDAP